VDCQAKVMEIKKQGGFSKIVFELPSDIIKYIVEKGPVAIDGISLTVASIDERRFDVEVIPETIRRTNIQTYESGSIVNIEADLMAKYIEKMLKQDKGKNQPEFFSEENLKKLGYI
jgi:riboflavin synthase